MIDRKRLIASALSASLLTAGASSAVLAQEEAEPVLLPAEGIEWRLETYVLDPELGMTDVPGDVEVSLFLSGGDVVGNAGCNSYFGSYEIDETSLTFPSPFGTTRLACEGAAQDVENAYLALLQDVQGWSIDEGGMLELSGAEGTTTLVYSEAPVEITPSDIEALGEELASLQAQIDTAQEEVAALTAEFESVNVSRLRSRISANEEAIAEIEATIGRFRNRISANEEAIARIDRTIDRFRERIITLEETAADHEERLAALESGGE